jgi:hypothetical protein
MSFFRMNRENRKCQAAHIKVIKTHFSGSNIDTQIFTDMESSVLPCAIAWMGQDGGDNEISGLLFAFIRSMPLLCEMKNKSRKRKTTD